MRRTLLAVPAAALLCAAPSAPAAVVIGPQQVTVTTKNATAVVTRAPFRLEIRDGAGAPRLQEMPNTGAPPAAGADVHQEPLGSENLPTATLYEPLAFEVGGAANPQWPAASWIGNLLAGATAGTIYSAREVVSATAADGGAKLVIATSDPSGRQLEVTVAPRGDDAIRVAARVTPSDGVSSVADSFVAPPGERFFGFGGRHNALDQRGNDLLGFIQEQNLGGGYGQPVADVLPGSGGDRYLFPNGPTATFYPQNSMVSSRGYAFLGERTELTRWRMASSRDDSWQMVVDGPRLEYIVAPGPPARAIGALTEITGRHRAPEAWASGPTITRAVKVLSADADTPASYEAKVRADLKEIERRRPPLTSYTFEGWNTLPRSVTKELIAEIRKLGLRPMLYIRSYVARDVAGTEPGELFDEAVTNGYFARTAAGTPYLFGSTFIAGVAGLVDFTNPAAVTWWQRRVREMLDLGADGFMQDFGEQVLLDMRFADGSTGLEMHNRYPTLYHRITRETIDAWEREHPDRGKVFFYTRTGYSGTPGAAAYESSNFPGDETTDWSRASGLGSLTTDMLNRAVGGLYGYNTDIGGYADFNNAPTSKELFVRWSQWAALSPVFRVHNSASNGTKMPWTFDDEAYAAWREAAELHVEARPLILELWREAQRTGLPPTRPLWLTHPDESDAVKQDQAWLLGDDVLVAPIVVQGATSRDVWFPPGCWEHGRRPGERHRGPATVKIAAPLGSLPYFVRCGTRPFETGDGLGLPSARRCASRRSFTIRLSRRLKSASVTVAGRRATVRRRGGRLTATVDLRRLRRGTYRVTIQGRDAKRRTLSASRTYRTCRPR